MAAWPGVHNRSPGAVAGVFNDNNVGGARTWSSNRIRKLYARTRLVGVEFFRMTKQIRDRDTGHVDVVENDRREWMSRECPGMRILSDELAEAVKAKLNLGSMRFGKNAADLRRDGKDPGRRVDVHPTVLVRPVCGGCGKPMALSRSTGKYKSFVCLNSIHGGHGCRNKGNKSARIIDEAVLKAGSAQILDDGFITDLTAEVNIRLAEAARRPRDTEKKLEQEITSRQRQVARLMERLEKVEDAGGLDTIFNKVAELNRQLEAKRAELEEEQRRNRRPPVRSVPGAGGHAGNAHATGCCNTQAKPRSHDTSRIAWAKLMARVGEEFPLECPACGGDIRLISFITEPGPIRKILTHLGEPLEPPPISPARGPPTDWGELVQVHDDRDIFQSSPDELPAIDIHSL